MDNIERPLHQHSKCRLFGVCTIPFGLANLLQMNEISCNLALPFCISHIIILRKTSSLADSFKWGLCNPGSMGMHLALISKNFTQVRDNIKNSIFSFAEK
jgi:hypothetical protein